VILDRLNHLAESYAALHRYALASSQADILGMVGPAGLADLLKLLDTLNEGLRCELDYLRAVIPPDVLVDG
jgi:hypothetical protein